MQGEPYESSQPNAVTYSRTHPFDSKEIAPLPSPDPTTPPRQATEHTCPFKRKHPHNSRAHKEACSNCINPPSACHCSTEPCGNHKPIHETSCVSRSSPKPATACVWAIHGQRGVWVQQSGAELTCSFQAGCVLYDCGQEGRERLVHVR